MVTAKKWALATFILCFLVILAGGVVRTTQSGMGCPDWPTCFGKWIPPTSASELPPDFEKYLDKQDIDHTFNVYHTWIEYFNRLLGVLLGMFAVVQCFLLYRFRKAHRSFKLSLWFLLTVVLTGIFGAIVVRLNLAHFSVSIHLLFALVLVQVQLALLLSLNGTLSSIQATSSIKRLLVFFLAILLIQSVLGTIVRIHVDDVSKLLGYISREDWLKDMPAVFLIHRTFSWFVLATAIYIAWACRNTAINIRSYILAGLVVMNMITGIVLYYADMPRFAQPLHLLLASMVITQAFYIILSVRKDPYIKQQLNG